MSKADLWQLYRIASLYYREGRTQEEISERENVSRSQVSRLLDHARQLGIVKIDVTLPDQLREETLTHFLEKNLKLEKLILAPVEKDFTDAQVTAAVAQTAAAVLPRLLKNATAVGLGWGETMYRTAASLPNRSVGSETLFLPLIGASGNSQPSLQINTIIDRFSEHLQGDRFFVNLPAFREKTVPLTAYESKRLRMLREYWDGLDTAVIGLGGLRTDLSFFDDEVSEASLARIEHSGVVGDILSQFFFEDGSLLEADESYYTNALPLERLPELPRTICLAGGQEKTVAILAAARAGYFKILITDTNTAQALYEQIRREI